MQEAKVNLDLRGTALRAVDRDTLMELPESILLCLFPNGVVLNQQRPDGSNSDDDVFLVDFDATCLDFLLNFFSQAKQDFYGPPGSIKRQQRQAAEIANPAAAQNPLFHKQAIIVLREELEYFAIPPAHPKDQRPGHDFPATDEDGLANDALLGLKKGAGDTLLSRKQIFTALQRNVNRDNNVAEQHLIDMLCMSGFNKEDEWGYRALEPNRCCITSIALVLLKTGISHPDTASNDASNTNVSVNASQLATAQKLLLFWRKPARKCWWDATEVELPSPSTLPTSTVKVWARRVWTLELSLI